MGQVITGGVGQNPARQALIQAGLPKEVTGFSQFIKYVDLG